RVGGAAVHRQPRRGTVRAATAAGRGAAVLRGVRAGLPAAAGRDAASGRGGRGRRGGHPGSTDLDAVRIHCRYSYGVPFSGLLRHNERMDTPDPLAPFLPPVREWFRSELGEPTPAQRQGWPAIAAGRHTLILAPTGSGKTLAAFLACLDGLWRQD